ncbi:hypothetical protein [Lysobacter humi (ex Lee et al. 2017)]
MVVVNPYRPPSVDVGLPAGDGCHRDGRDGVYVPRGADLPARCVRCNAPVAGARKRRTLYWHSPWLYLLIAIGLLVYAVVALIVRRRAEASPGLCALHAAQVRRTRWIGVGLGLGAFGAMFAAFSSDRVGLGLLCLLAACVVFAVTAIRARLVRPTRIDERGMRLVGFGEAFLASIPPALR